MQEKAQEELVEGDYEEVPAEEVEPEKPKQYIGKTAIAKFEKHEDKNLVGVLLEDNRQYSLSVRQFESMVSDEPYDEAMVDKRKWRPLVAAVLEGMLDDQATVGDKDTILQMIDDSVVQNYNLSISKLYGVSHPTQTLLAQVDAVLGNEVSIKYE